MQVPIPWTNQPNISSMSLPGLPVGCGSLVWTLHADSRRYLVGFCNNMLKYRSHAGSLT